MHGNRRLYIAARVAALIAFVFAAVASVAVGLARGDEEAPPIEESIPQCTLEAVMPRSLDTGCPVLARITCPSLGISRVVSCRRVKGDCVCSIEGIFDEPSAVGSLEAGHGDH